MRITMQIAHRVKPAEIRYLGNKLIARLNAGSHCFAELDKRILRLLNNHVVEAGKVAGLLEPLVWSAQNVGRMRSA